MVEVEIIGLPCDEKSFKTRAIGKHIYEKGKWGGSKKKFSLKWSEPSLEPDFRLRNSLP